jgi:uncharacterized protein YdhG (YjbR/CyaY superfamily)
MSMSDSRHIPGDTRNLLPPATQGYSQIIGMSRNETLGPAFPVLWFQYEKESAPICRTTCRATCCATNNSGGTVPTTRTTPKSPKNIDEYIASRSPEVRAILEKIRATIKNAAPDAQETISYRIPAFTLNGVLVYFAAFKKHVGLYPPIRGDAKLQKAVSRYAGEKGNLRFPLDRPIPYRLIERIVKLRVKQNLAKALH